MGHPLRSHPTPEGGTKPDIGPRSRTTQEHAAPSANPLGGGLKLWHGSPSTSPTRLRGPVRLLLDHGDRAAHLPRVPHNGGLHTHIRSTENTHRPSHTPRNTPRQSTTSKPKPVPVPVLFLARAHSRRLLPALPSEVSRARCCNASGGLLPRREHRCACIGGRVVAKAAHSQVRALARHKPGLRGGPWRAVQSQSNLRVTWRGRCGL